MGSRPTSSLGSRPTVYFTRILERPLSLGILFSISFFLLHKQSIRSKDDRVGSRPTRPVGSRPTRANVAAEATWQRGTLQSFNQEQYRWRTKVALRILVLYFMFFFVFDKIKPNRGVAVNLSAGLLPLAAARGSRRQNKCRARARPATDWAAFKKGDDTLEATHRPFAVQ